MNIYRYFAKLRFGSLNFNLILSKFNLKAILHLSYGCTSNFKILKTLKLSITEVLQQESTRKNTDTAKKQKMNSFENKP